MEDQKSIENSLGEDIVSTETPHKGHCLTQKHLQHLDTCQWEGMSIPPAKDIVGWAKDLQHSQVGQEPQGIRQFFTDCVI